MDSLPIERVAMTAPAILPMITDRRRKRDAFVIRYGSRYYVGGYPHLADSYTTERTKASRYERAVAANVREHVSAYTHGNPVCVERA